MTAVPLTTLRQLEREEGRKRASQRRGDDASARQRLPRIDPLQPYRDALVAAGLLVPRPPRGEVTPESPAVAGHPFLPIAGPYRDVSRTLLPEEHIFDEQRPSWSWWSDKASGP